MFRLDAGSVFLRPLGRFLYPREVIPGFFKWKGRSKARGNVANSCPNKSASIPVEFGGNKQKRRSRSDTMKCGFEANKVHLRDADRKEDEMSKMNEREGEVWYV